MTYCRKLSASTMPTAPGIPARWTTGDRHVADLPRRSDKVLRYLLDSDKTLSCCARLGQRTVPLTPMVRRAENLTFSGAEQLARRAGGLRGDIGARFPHYYSALVSGRSCTNMPRRGIEVPREARPITVMSCCLFSVKVTSWSWKFCSKALYSCRY